MPKVSKIAKSAKSNPGEAAPIKERPDKFYCTRCPRDYKRQKGNFPASQSPIYKENGGYLPVCKHCIDEMFQHYKEVLGDEKAAIRRICMKFDIYWNDRIYAMLNKSSTTSSRVLSYISKSNLYQFIGKTYDDTLDEEMGLSQAIIPSADSTDGVTGVNIFEDDSDSVDGCIIDPKIIEFWGTGFPPSFYVDLERRLKYWCGDAGVDAMDVSECAIIRQICMLEVTIARDTASGKAIDKSINALNTLLGSANLKPIQKKKEESLDEVAESTPFGVWIRKIEDTRPIKEVDPQLKDVDHVAKYISTWFFGHLCKMLKINNTFSSLYEEEMERLRVERPEYEGEDEEAIFEDVFERATKKEQEESGVGYGD